MSFEIENKKRIDERDVIIMVLLATLFMLLYSHFILTNSYNELVEIFKESCAFIPKTSPLINVSAGFQIP